MSKVKNRVVNENGLNGLLKPKKVICSRCKENEIIVKFVIARQAWSRKNNWEFWTGKEEYKDKEYCGECLRQIFYDKEVYWQAVQNSKRRSLFRVYLARGEI